MPNISAAKRYFSINQFRLDTWHSLKQQVETLHHVPINLEIVSEKITKLGLEIQQYLSVLLLIEQYWAYPGLEAIKQLEKHFVENELALLLNEISEISRFLMSGAYRDKPLSILFPKLRKADSEKANPNQHYFEVLLVDTLLKHEETEIRERIANYRNIDDKFLYEVVFASTFQDALISLLFNYNIQSVVIRYAFPFATRNNLTPIMPFIGMLSHFNFENRQRTEMPTLLGKLIRIYRPELDVYYVTDTVINYLPNEVLKTFNRIFYRQENTYELHLSIIKGIRNRFETPFFSALIDYSQKPTGIFHAMPVSRGNSVFNSRWIRDFGDFYGRNLFLAETSATTGGLDSLLQPTGPLKKAQEMAADVFGSKHTYFVTNGTSTANKITLQALVQPGDVVLIDRECHKSHHYGLVNAGACPVYLDSYPIEKFSMYGAVPIAEIIKRLLDFKHQNTLHKVKVLILTNCTFDGLTYHIERLIESVLCIKPDMIFFFDEAWFGFARFSPTYRQRTAMYVAQKLYHRYKSDKYKELYEQFLETGETKDAQVVAKMPNPNEVKIRVYATQSTHKTLTSLRQGSMIHVWDELFNTKVERPFHEAYMNHTSTSPNYQILASLDVGRRQLEFEGYELVEKSVEMAMILRERIMNNPIINKYFELVKIKDLIPEPYRASGISRYYDAETGFENMDEAWQKDEFVLDPTKINLFLGKTGIDGETFKKEYLMNQFGIQVNKTTRNTVLFMTNIGTTKGSIAYLIGVLLNIAEELEQKELLLNPTELKLHQKNIDNFTNKLPPLPNFSYFHKAFKPSTKTQEGNIRAAFFLAYNEEFCEYLKICDCEEQINKGREVVATGFVTPYPPGFPILVPGQVITKQILDFMKALEVKEIHSYRPELGIRVFKNEVLITYMQQ